ncbi:branched-chain amino acid ABC transporter permease [Streptomyces sp. NPDC058335]|uniref:branched-chain amino acid ABC transporter permease n=1 Tax=Streptomyces sp. NPDC058335 TaxID=3346451 RepID=UPI00364CBC38
MLSYLVTGLAVGALYALSGTGLVVLYRASGTLNLAYGAAGAGGVLLCWELYTFQNLTMLTAITIGVLVTTALSLAWGVLIEPLLMGRDVLVKAAATLGLALAILGLCNWYWNDKARSLNLPSDAHGFDLAGVRVNLTQVLAFAVALLATVLASTFLRTSVTGTVMRALANDRQLSSMLGVRVRRVEALAWLISGFTAGVSSILLADLTLLTANNLTFLVIPALAAALIGRLESLWLTLAGGLVIGVVEASLTQFPAISPYRAMAPFVIAIAVTLWLGRHKVYSMRSMA